MKSLPIRFLSVLTAAGAVVALSVSAQAQAPSPSDNVKKLLAERACASCHLESASLSAANLQGVNLTAAFLFEANLYFADLQDANLTGANLTSANLKKAQLKGANLNGADLTGANLMFATDANFTGATTTATTICPDGAAGPCRRTRHQRAEPCVGRHVGASHGQRRAAVEPRVLAVGQRDRHARAVACGGVDEFGAVIRNVEAAEHRLGLQQRALAADQVFDRIDGVRPV